MSAATRGPTGTSVPFEFVTPPDAPTTDTRRRDSQTYWQLSVSAGAPGFDFDADYVLPLFAVGPASDGREFASVAQKHGEAFAERQFDTASGVTARETGDRGEEIVIGSHATFVTGTIAVIFLALWNGAIYAMLRFRVHPFFPISFAFFDFFFLFAGLDFLVGRTAIQASREGVSCRHTLFGAGKTITFPAVEIVSVRSVGDRNDLIFSVELKLKQRHRRSGTLVRELRSRADADSIAARIEKALGKVHG